MLREECVCTHCSQGGLWCLVQLPAVLRGARLRRWVLHLTLNAVNDGDLVFMHRQSQWLRQTEHGDHPGEHYYLPGESDRCVWLVSSSSFWLALAASA